MKTVVTGGRGFIGSHLVDALVERGDDVTVIDDGSSGDNDRDGVRYRKWDLTQGVPVFDADVVFHVAAVGRTPAAIADPVGCWDRNLMASVRVLQGAVESGVSRVVLSSSNIVYAAETPYKASKLAMEHAARVYKELYGLSTICLRYANTYGPRQREDGVGPNVFPSLRKSLRENGYINVSGDGAQSRDFVHVSDVVEANLLATAWSGNGELDICTGRNVSMNGIASLLGCEVRYTPDRRGDVKHIVQDPQPAFRALGFQATIPLEQGIWDSFPELAGARVG